MKQAVLRFIREEDGVSAIEYGLIAALIAIVIIGALTVAGTSLKSMFSTVASTLASATGGG